MGKIIDKSDKQWLGEIMIIVGGFLFSETLIRRVIDFSEHPLGQSMYSGVSSVVPLWIFAAYGMLLTIAGVPLKRGDSPGWLHFFAIISLGSAILFLVLPDFFRGGLALGIMIFLLICLVVGIIISRKKKSAFQNVAVKKEEMQAEKNANNGKISWKFFTLVVVLLIFFSVILTPLLQRYSGEIVKLVPGIIVFIGLCLVVCVILNIYLYWRKGSEKSYMKNLTIIVSLIGTLLVFSQLMVSSSQTNIIREQKDIANQQTEILARTSQSIYPELLVLSLRGKMAYRLSDFSIQNESIEIGITNLGRATAPWASIEIERGTFWSAVNIVNSPFAAFQGIKSSEYNSTIFNFWINPNIRENFTAGEKNLTFRVDCPVCREQVQRQNIPICVYATSPEIDCGEGWKNNYS